MGLFDRIFPKKQIMADSFFKTFTAYQPRFTSFCGSIYESELVRAAIEAKASHISKMEVSIIGSAKPRLQTKLKAGPNQWQTWSQFLRRLSTIYDVCTTAFIIPVFDDFGEVSGVFPGLPDTCEIVEHNGIAYLRYKFATGDIGSIELSQCGILVNHQYRSDFFGEKNDIALKPTMDLIAIENQGIVEGVKNSTTYRLMARMTNFAKQEDLTKERKKFNELNFSSEAEGGGILLIPNTYSDVKQLTNNQYVVPEGERKRIETNVYNYFGVNEKILQNSARSADLNAFYDGALEPFAVQLAEVMTKMLFTERERASGAGVSVNANRLQYMSPSEKLDLIKTMGDRGMLRINEARLLLNYPPVDGGDEMMPIRNEYVNVTNKTEDEDGE